MFMGGVSAGGGRGVADSGGRLGARRHSRSARVAAHTLHRCVEGKGTGVPVGLMARRDEKQLRLR